VWVHLEPIIYVLRASDNGEGIGGPYEFSATVIVRGSSAEIIGASGSLKLRWYREMRRQLNAIGVERVMFQRTPDGKEHTLT